MSVQKIALLQYMTKLKLLANLLGLRVFAYLQFNLFQPQGSHAFSLSHFPSATNKLPKSFHLYDLKPYDISIKLLIHILLEKGGQRQATLVNLTASGQYFNQLNRKNNPFLFTKLI